MEKEIKIKTPDKHVVYGTLRLANKKSDSLLIFVHGLTGYRNEHKFYNGARYFAAKNINTFRFDLYSWEKDARKLSDCGLSTHAADLNTVVKFFRKKFKKIFVAGHSFGGITILLSDTSKVDGIILWDSSYSRDRDDEKYDKHLDAYIIKWGVEFIYSKKMHEEHKNFPAPKVAIKKVSKPIKVIVAGAGMLVKPGKEYFKHANEPKELAIIKGAHHNFDEGETAQELFRETYEFIKKY
ncbi:MAG: alpha/beta fold hydrolase [Patescibacteria group bacterium]